jgi:hypothetical protein
VPDGSEAAQRFRVSSDAVAQRVGDELVLIHLTTDRIYVLNSTAARAWELLCAEHDIEAVRRGLLQEFAVSEDQVSEELDRLLEWLRVEQVVLPDAEQ